VFRSEVVKPVEIEVRLFVCSVFLPPISWNTFNLKCSPIVDGIPVSPLQFLIHLKNPFFVHSYFAPPNVSVPCKMSAL
jgi:hypothetical protein